MKGKSSFVCYSSWASYIASLPDEQAAQLAKAIACFNLGAEYEIKDQSLKIFFDSVVRPQMEADSAKYQERIENAKRSTAKRIDNSKSVTQSEKANASVRECTQSDASVRKRTQAKDSVGVSVSDSVSVSVSDSVSDNVSVSVSEKDKKDTIVHPDPVPYTEIVDKFNSICTSLPKVKTLTNDRRKHIRAVYNAVGGMESIEKMFHMVEESDFLSGKNGKWKASFDWVMTVNNATKVLEGNYKSNKGSSFDANDYLMGFINGERDVGDDGF